MLLESVTDSQLFFPWLGRWRLLAVALLFSIPLLLLGCSDGGKEGGQGSAAFTWGINGRLRKDFAVLQGTPRSLPKELSPPGHIQNDRLMLSRGWPLLITLERRVWAAPNGHRLCLVDHSGSDGTGITCSALMRVLRHGITSTFLREGTDGSQANRSIVGLAPDGAARVRVHTPGYPAAVVPVRRNVFLLHDQVPEPPETVELLGRG